MSMKFVCCIPGRLVGKDNLGEGSNSEEPSFLFCKCDIVCDILPDDPQSVKHLLLKDISISEGSEIFVAERITINDIKLFNSQLGMDQERGKTLIRENIWYEFIKLLTGHRICIPSMENQIAFTRWIVHVSDDGVWKIVLEFESEGIIEKYTEIALEGAQSGEMDLFLLSNQIFQQSCSSNDEIHTLNTTIALLQEQIEEHKNNQRILDEMIEKRDSDTRNIVLTLLNDKKKKIIELSQKLELFDKEYREKQDDSNYINKNVNNAITELISPGKKKRIRNDRDIMDDLKKKNIGANLEVKLKQEEKNDDFDDFQFFGIRRSIYQKTENIPDVHITLDEPVTEISESPFIESDLPLNNDNEMPTIHPVNSESPIDSSQDLTETEAHVDTNSN